MSHRVATDIPLLVRSENTSSERRVSPSWTISHFKSRLEPITGVPASCQKLTLGTSHPDRTLEVEDEDSSNVQDWGLQPYSEIVVQDTRPTSARTNFHDLESVKKYEMPTEQYEARPDSVLAWKRSQKLGRFDPSAPSLEDQKIRALRREVEERGVSTGRRCHLLPVTDARRGIVSYIGDVPQIPGVGTWVGLTLDEPTGKNDGSIGGQRYFECKMNCGIFVRPERVEVGDYPPLEDLDSEMEEI
ncbi:hypothetical protein EV356DRAFT_537722 [Viridothelium virens]|uniref:CAP-Gly domain-containing protein n=1 Tax=Viridothelium virens TaxID=1048519 RepID=A0A6A6GT68_VIRVR|nr:hypothetical protein EV356DRAFT_537722 [Viridothelium virens]